MEVRSVEMERKGEEQKRVRVMKGRKRTSDERTKERAIKGRKRTSDGRVRKKKGLKGEREQENER